MTCRKCNNPSRRPYCRKCWWERTAPALKQLARGTGIAKTERITAVHRWAMPATAKVDPGRAGVNQ